MAYPQYFRNLPNIEYVSGANKRGQIQYLDIKDYFVMSSVREDIFAEDTLYVDYTVQNGTTPDQISFEEYGDEQYYWTILQINGITEYYNDWPMSQVELDEYILRKYGSDTGAAQTKQWETREVLDENGNLVLPAGMVVSEDFVFEYPATPGSNSILTSTPYPVSYRQWEYALNESKGEIQILNQTYVAEYARETKNNARRGSPQKRQVDIAEFW